MSKGIGMNLNVSAFELALTFCQYEFPLYYLPFVIMEINKNK